MCHWIAPSSSPARWLGKHPKDKKNPAGQDGEMARSTEKESGARNALSVSSSLSSAPLVLCGVAASKGDSPGLFRALTRSPGAVNRVCQRIGSLRCAWTTSSLISIQCLRDRGIKASPTYLIHRRRVRHCSPAIQLRRSLRWTTSAPSSPLFPALSRPLFRAWPGRRVAVRFIASAYLVELGPAGIASVSRDNP